MSPDSPMKKDFADALPRLKRLLPRFRNVRVAVLGDLMLDRYLWGNANRLSPEAAVPVVDFVSQNDCPGGAANVAGNLAALGAHVRLFGLLGGRQAAQRKIVDDEPGQSARDRRSDPGYPGCCRDMALASADHQLRSSAPITIHAPAAAVFLDK